MSYFNSDTYRESIRKRLDESDSLGMGDKIRLRRESEKPKYETDVLASIREKLFGAAESVAGMEDSGEATASVGTPTNDGATVSPDGQIKTEDSYQEQPKGDPSAPLAGAEDGEPTLSADDLGDMATDTIMDILNSIKELRDKVKKEDPKKAALIRRIYDHLLKGKEKITAEILKAAQEEAGGGEKNEGKW
jgi:hypothetical protein